MNDLTIDRRRAAELMEQGGIDALVLFQPEHVAWALDVNPGPAALFRRAGAAMAVVPRAPSAAMIGVLPDLSRGAVARGCQAADVAFHRIWVETASVPLHADGTPLASLLGSGKADPRPATFDPRLSLSLLAERLAASGLSDARLGLDLGFVPVADMPAIREALPRAELIDGTGTIRRLRMVKTPREIHRLRTAASLTEAGFRRALEGVRPGAAPRELGDLYGHGVREAARAAGAATTGLWDYISVGPDPWGAGRPAEQGDVIKFDLGVLVSGYSSDFARTVCVGRSSRAACELHAALRDGLEAGLSRLAPGVPLADVYLTMLDTIRRHGVAGYARGHFGHGLGNDPFSEQWPFIAADSDVAAEAGMVLAVEAPHYVDGLGGFIIEDQVLVTATGVERMTLSPYDLLAL